MCVAILLGCIVELLRGHMGGYLGKAMRVIPYTTTLLVIGVAIGAIHASTREDCGYGYPRGGGKQN